MMQTPIQVATEHFVVQLNANREPRPLAGVQSENANCRRRSPIGAAAGLAGTLAMLWRAKELRISHTERPIQAGHG